MNDKERKVVREEIIHEMVVNKDRRHPSRAQVVDHTDMGALHTILRVRAGQRDTAINGKEVIDAARAIACERGMLIEVPENRRKR